MRISPAEAAEDTAARLKQRFDVHLQDPAAFGTRVRSECAAFPEGDLLPFTFCVMGYTNDALRHPGHLAANCARAAKLIELAIPSVLETVEPPEGRLDRLPDYREHAVHLGWLALALGCYRLMGGDDRWEAEHTRIADVLHQALVAAEGKPLRSHPRPRKCRSFDTVAPLLALALHDRHRGTDRSAEACATHLEWVREHGTDPNLRLPYSQVPDGVHDGPAPPRGGDLALRICLLAQLDPNYARQLYQAFRRHFWVERGYLAGFAEWPDKSDQADVDSGPILQGMGLVATGFGVGTTACMGDAMRLGRLLFELSMATSLVTLFGGQLKTQFPMDKSCVTGSLMGDASVFAVAGWTPWTGRARAGFAKERPQGS